MAALCIARAALALAPLLLGVHVEGQLAVQEQVRAGLSQTPGVSSGASMYSIAEIVAPSGQLHLTFTRADQDLLVRYQPRFLDTLQIRPGAGGAQWAGWTQMHRGLIQYRAGDPKALQFTGQINVAAGKLDVSEPDGVVAESGILPGALGQVVNYTNINGTFSVSQWLSRHWRLRSTEVLGLIQYPARPTGSYLQAMPGLVPDPTTGNETQLRIGSRNEVEYAFSERHALALNLEFLDVSYVSSASYPSFIPALAYTHKLGGRGLVRLHGGVMKYWANPTPGIIRRAEYMPVADVTLDHTFAAVGAPRLGVHAMAGIAPFFNLQYSSIEPRSTVLVQLNYAATKRLSVLGSARLLSSKFSGYGLRQLPGGHPTNIFLLNAGIHYNWRDILVFDANAYASDQRYQAAATQAYTELRQVYVLLGIRGTWDIHKRR